MKQETLVYFIGTAGSGKSTLTHCFQQWMNNQGLDAITVNLDPGAENLPYVPDVDIKELIDALSLSDLITFASSSAANNLKEILQKNKIVNQKNRTKIPKAAAIGPITSKSARESGFDVVAEAKQYTIPGLVLSVVKYFNEAHKE